VPVTWSTDAKSRLMTAVATGTVTRAEIENFFDETTAADVAPYRKLFDGRSIDTDMVPEEVLALGVKMQGLHKPGSDMGPLAIVLPLQLMELARRMLGILAVSQRPLGVFVELAEAKAWLNETDRSSSSKPTRRVKGAGVL
jgi:hypothetical protein